jgi:hypothetical protein
MIPILEPAQFPGILGYAMCFVITLGIPTALLSFLIFFVLEHTPSHLARRILPAAGAVLLLALSLLLFSGQQTEEEYRQTWALTMTTGFLMNALVILAPYPFIRHALRSYSPYLTLGFAVLVTFFFLTCFGFLGGETKMALDAAEYQREYMMRTAGYFVAELVTATLIYAGIAALTTGLSRVTTRKE